MTTFRYTVDLNESEMGVVEAALKLYVTPEARQLMRDNPKLVDWYGYDTAEELVKSGKLYKNATMMSTSSFCFDPNQREG